MLMYGQRERRHAFMLADAAEPCRPMERLGRLPLI
jgi:hypothetical protein